MFSQGDQNTPNTATSTEKAGAEKATAAEALVWRPLVPLMAPAASLTPLAATSTSGW